jgi:redox-sensitive bicupin YhaK (pirin superfamily)
MKFDMSKAKNNWMQLVSPNADDEGLWIHQNAWFSLTELDQNSSLAYQVKLKMNGVYVFVIEGSAKIGNQILNERDGYGIWDISNFEIKANSDKAKVLVMDVPYKES